MNENTAHMDDCGTSPTLPPALDCDRDGLLANRKGGHRISDG